MKIGSIDITNNIFLAPMAGVTDLPFRLLCKKEGCGMTYTEMISAKGLYYYDEKTKDLLATIEDEQPFVVQIFGSEPNIIGQVVANLNNTKADIIDINMGCPTPKIVKNGDGCALMLNPKLVGQVIKSAVSNTSKPITIKIRKGWDENCINAVEVAKIAEENGAKAIAVHGRTREQFYSGKADWDIIKKVKEAVAIPVIGNGDVFAASDAVHMLEQTKCDAVMVGRGARGNPWIFSQIINYKDGDAKSYKPSAKEIIEKIMEHYKLTIDIKGEKIAIKEMRKHIAWYIKGLKNSNKLKDEINSQNEISKVFDLLNSYSE